MVTLIILIALFGIGFYLTTKWDYEVLGGFMCLIFGTWLLIHCVCYFTVSFRHELFVAKRNAFEQTLNEARANGNEYETAAIVKEVAIWNQELASDKYKNNTIYFDQFIDDRIELLEPIK